MRRGCAASIFVQIIGEVLVVIFLSAGEAILAKFYLVGPNGHTIILGNMGRKISSLCGLYLGIAKGRPR